MNTWKSLVYIDIDAQLKYVYGLLADLAIPTYSRTEQALSWTDRDNKYI